MAILQIKFYVYCNVSTVCKLHLSVYWYCTLLDNC